MTKLFIKIKKRQQKIELDQNPRKRNDSKTHLIEEQQKQSKKNMQNLETPDENAF